MRRWMILVMLTGLLAGLVGCNSKDQEVTKEAEQTDAQMQTPEMKEWYNKNADKQPADATSQDAVVTGDKAAPAEPAPAAPAAPAPAAPAAGN